MRSFIIVALAVCLPTLIVADLVCNECNLDGVWRTRTNSENNDDESIRQEFDGQADWLRRWADYQNALAEWSTEGIGMDSLRVEAQSECKAALPDRVYNFRYERVIDNGDYEIREYIYRGYQPSEPAWDRYCRLFIDEYAQQPTDTHAVYVEVIGASTKRQLKGSVSVVERGVIEEAGGGGCNVIFRPKVINTQCLVKNEAGRYPTQNICQNQANVPGGGAVFARYGCQANTWDSDSNDDNIEENCNRMYFISSNDAQSGPLAPNVFSPGNSKSSFDAGPLAWSQDFKKTPENYCEYRAAGTGFSDFADAAGHGCQ